MAFRAFSILLAALACGKCQCFPCLSSFRSHQRLRSFFFAANADPIHHAPSSSALATNATTDSTNQTASSSGGGGEISLLLQQAQALRAEASSLQKALNESRIEKLKRQEEKVDRWIDELFVQWRVDDQTELLKTVDQAVDRLRDDRYSQEQINKIFKRICETHSKQSRSNHSPLMALLLDAVGKMDDVDRPDQENKRWSGRVEQALQRKLFAADWNIDLVDEEEEDRKNPWKLK